MWVAAREGSSYWFKWGMDKIPPKKNELNYINNIQPITTYNCSFKLNWVIKRIICVMFKQSLCLYVYPQLMLHVS